MKRLIFVAIGALLISGSFVTSAGAAPVRSDENCRAKKGQATCIALSQSGVGASATSKGSTITLTTGTAPSAAFAGIRNFWDMSLSDIESIRLSVVSVAGGLDPTGGSPRISLSYGNDDGPFLYLSPYHCAGFVATSTEWQTVDFVTSDCTIYSSTGEVYDGWDDVVSTVGVGDASLWYAFVVQDEGPATNKIKISVG